MIEEQDLQLLEGDIDATREGDTVCLPPDVATELIYGYRKYREMFTWAHAQDDACSCPSELISICMGYDDSGCYDGDDLNWSANWSANHDG